MANNQLTLAGDTLPFALPRVNGTIIGQLDLNGAAGVTVVLEVQVSSARGWAAVKLFDPVADAKVSNLSTDEQIGWAENPGYTAARWRLSAIVSGGPVQIATNAPEN